MTVSILALREEEGYIGKRRIVLGPQTRRGVSCSMARMKNAKCENRSSAVRDNVSSKSIDEYLAGVPEPARSSLQKVRVAIRSAAPPEAAETISYGMPAFKYKGVLVWFAAFRNHCSFFPTASVVEAFKGELKGLATSKGTIQFPPDKPLPATLIKKMVKLRVAQIESKKRR